jgi:23S rRNA-/tRNA-specific pseudouridylate synthase
MERNFIGFPPHTIRESSTRVKILLGGDDFLAIDKPPNVPSEKIIEHFPKQRAGLDPCHPKEVFALDEEISGIFLIAKTKKSAAELRNFHGSQLFTFTFDLLTLPTALDKTITCDLPIAKHSSRYAMVVSHKTGKKSHTDFRFIENVGPYEHWQATTRFLRPHQIRLHAHECGLGIIGENLYASHGVDVTKKFLKTPNLENHWSTQYLPIHLSCLGINSSKKIESPLPKKFQSLMKLLQK